jgi:pimeloyl-ACP methyl ester carboxylesterase
MEVVRVNGLKVAYERVGEGPLVVLVHGAGVDSRMWRPQLAALSDEFTVVAWDEPGAGRSDDLPAGFGLADYTHCLAAVIDAVSLGSAHVTGLSWGGTLVQELYRRHPEQVAALILAGSYAGWKGSLLAEEVQARLRGVREMLAAGERYDPPGLFAGEAPAEFADLLKEMTATARPASLEAQMSMMAQTDQRDLLPRIAVPTLLVWGDSDARSPLSVARQFKDAIPQAELAVISGAGHVSNLEQPGAFNDAVRKFCRDHPPSASSADARLQ